MLSVAEVREQIQRMLIGVVSQDDFEDWLVGASWNMHQHADLESQALASAIELRLAEHSSGHLDSIELRHELSMLLMHGCQPKAMQMPVMGFVVSGAVTVSGTAPVVANIQSIVVAVDRVVSSQTRSASGRSITAKEALAAT
jgi:hypothetical protein